MADPKVNPTPSPAKPAPVTVGPWVDVTVPETGEKLRLQKRSDGIVVVNARRFDTISGKEIACVPSQYKAVDVDAIIAKHTQVAQAVSAGLAQAQAIKAALPTLSTVAAPAQAAKA